MQDLTNDHDVLIELRGEVRGLRNDINKFSTDTITRIDSLEKYKVDVDAFREKNKDVFDTTTDHEIRLRSNETSVTRIMTWGTALVFGLGLIEFALYNYLH